MFKDILRYKPYKGIILWLGLSVLDIPICMMLDNPNIVGLFSLMGFVLAFIWSRKF